MSSRKTIENPPTPSDSEEESTGNNNDESTMGSPTPNKNTASKKQPNFNQLSLDDQIKRINAVVGKLLQNASFPVWKPNIDHILNRIRRGTESWQRVQQRYSNLCLAPMVYPKNCFPKISVDDVIDHKHIKYINVVFRQLLRQLVYISTKYTNVFVFSENKHIDKAMKQIASKCILMVL